MGQEFRKTITRVRDGYQRDLESHNLSRDAVDSLLRSFDLSVTEIGAALILEQARVASERSAY